MAVAGRLARFAFGEPHVLVVQGFGGTPLRLSVEAAVRVDGWPLASSPADADLLVVCGGTDARLEETVERLRSGMPAPAEVLRLDAQRPDDVPAVLREARRRLWEACRRGRPAHGRAPRSDGEHAHGSEEHTHGEHGDMEMPGGPPMAERSEDRDGLQLDVLHVPLGPALTGWPPGLLVTLRLQGDIVQAVDVESPPHGDHLWRSWWDAPWLEAREGRPVPVAVAERRRAACHLDSLTRLLHVAGDEGSARAAGRLRDETLSGADASLLHEGVVGLGRRLDRWRLLDRMTAGTGRLDADAAQRLGVSGPALRATGRSTDPRQDSPAYPGFEPTVVGSDGDVRARWRQWLAETRDALIWTKRAGGHLPSVSDPTEGPRGTIGSGPVTGASPALLRAITELLPGQELAAARLTVASLDPDVDSSAGRVPAGEGR